MSRYQKFIANQPVRRGFVLLSLVFVLWLARSEMSTVLLTFIFSFLVIQLVNLIRRHVNIRPVIIVIPLYLLIIGGIFYAVFNYVPSLVSESIKSINTVIKFYTSGAFDHNQMIQWAVKSVKQMNLTGQIKTGLTAVLSYAGSIGSAGVTIALSFLLSFFFTVEIDELKHFGGLFIKSPLGWYFADLRFFALKFINTFGVIIEAQLIIAIVNTTITTITLIFLKMPNIPTLAVMVFFLSLIPVVGAIISVVPLTIIAFTVGGVQSAIIIIVMIVIIHFLEAYVLNPRLMASRTELPGFFTIVILIVAERLFGAWGLIVGIPIFTFLLDVFGVKKIGSRTAKQAVNDTDAKPKS